MAHICNKYKLGDIVMYNGDRYRVTSVRRTTTSIPYTIWDYEYNLFLDRDPREGELSLIKGVNERAISRKVDDIIDSLLYSVPTFYMSKDEFKLPTKEEMNAMFGVPKFECKKIIFNGPCTIILWKDGTKTIAKTSNGEMFDPEKGVAICFMKRALGETEGKKVLRKANKDFYDEVARASSKQLDEDLKKATLPLPKGVTFRPFTFDTPINTNKVIKVEKVEEDHKMDFRSCSTCKYASKPVTDKPCSNCASKSRYEKGYEK